MCIRDSFLAGLQRELRHQPLRHRGIVERQTRLSEQHLTHHERSTRDREHEAEIPGGRFHAVIMARPYNRRG